MHLASQQAVHSSSLCCHSLLPRCFGWGGGEGGVSFQYNTIVSDTLLHRVTTSEADSEDGRTRDTQLEG